MVPPHPITRLRQVALGLEALARELEDLHGVPPANLIWWRQEIVESIEQLERGAARWPARGRATR